MKKSPTYRMVKRFNLLAAAGWLMSVSASAQTSSLSQVNIAGSFNNFDTRSDNMTLIANNTWQGEIEIPTNNFRFKFATAFFAQNWGVNSAPHTTLPLAMTGVSGGGDIYITNPPIVSVSGGVTNSTTNYLLRFTFHDVTREFSVMRVGDIDSSNLLYNAGFETAGSVATRARYWESGNPNIHGAMLGTAERQGSNWNIRTHSGQWVGLMKARWAIQGNSGTWWQEAPVEGGLTYEASAYFQPEAAPNVWTAAVHQLRLEYYDFNRTNLLATFTRDLTGIPQSNTNWVQQFISGSAPVGAAWGRLVVFVDGIGPNGTYRIDSAALRATVAKRTEDFNEWTGTTLDGTYIKGGWSLTGRTVSVYAYSNQFISLARSGFAASLASGGTNTTGGSITSPRFNDGVGTITFYYRHGYQGGPDENAGAPVHLQIQRSLAGSSYTTVGTISNIVNTTHRRYSLTITETSRFVRIIHGGGSTNRIIIDDISIGLPEGEPRLMDFNTWTGATNDTYQYKNGWELTNGLVSAANALDELSGQIAGSTNNQHALFSPVFADGYGTVRFDYRAGVDSPRTLGFALEARAHPGTNWVELDRVTNINTMTWREYNRFFYNSSASQLRIRNLAETNTSSLINTDIAEGFTTDGPPSGWTFENIGYYTGAPQSGTNSGVPALRFDSSAARVTTPVLGTPTNIRFMIAGQSAAASNSFLVEGWVSNAWLSLTNISPISGSRTYLNVRLTGGVSQIRFSYSKPGAGNVSFDDFLAQGGGFTNPSLPQRLILDNVEVAAPVVSREQNFDSWPTKNAYDSGTVFLTGWRLDGPTLVNATKAYSGQSLTLSRQSTGGGGGSADYVVNFEGPSETKTSYTSNSVTLSGLSWNLTDVLIGDTSTDWKNGARSARMRGYGTSSMTMLANKTNGLGTISFNYQRYGTDSQTSYQVQISTNNGSSWSNAGATFTPSASLQTFTHNAFIEGSVRVRIRESTGTGTSNRRANIDDITMTSYSTGVGGSTTNSALYSPFLPGGIGPISFQYRHSFDTPPPPAYILTAAIQTSADGSSWSNRASLVISNTSFAAFELFLSDTNHFYARVAVTNGTGDALFDNFAVQLPQPAATVVLTGSTFPELPYTNDVVKLLAEASPIYGANNISVTSYYRIGTSGAFTAMAMNSLGENLFESVTNIPPQPKGTIVQYYMAAWYDGPGAATTRPVYYPAGATNELARYGIPRNPPGRVWINEIDYLAFDYGVAFTNTGEFVELAGLAGTDMSGWKIELWDGQTSLYYVFGSYSISNGTVLANETNGIGFFLLADPELPSPVPDIVMTNYLSDPLEFHRPGMIRLLNELGGIEHAVAFDGYVDGAYIIPVNDLDNSNLSDAPTQTVALVGTGINQSQFDWSAVTPRTPGAVNPGQSFGDQPVIALIPGSLTFTYIPGSVNPASQTLIVSNSGGSGLSYSIADNATWLSVSPLTGSNLAAGATQTHTVLVEIAGISGNRSASITLSGIASNTPAIVPVQLNETSLSSALIDYSFDNLLDGRIINYGSLANAANLELTNGASRTLEGQGVSGSLGDFGFLSNTNTGLAVTTNKLDTLNTQNVFTITGWLRPTGTTGVHRIIGNHAGTNGFELITATNRLMLKARNLTWWATNSVIASNTWTFYAVTYDGTKAASNAVEFYFGSVAGSAYAGHLVAPTGAITAMSSTNRLMVGGDGTNGFRGRIDDLRFHAGRLDLMNIEAIRKDGASSTTGTGSAPFIDSQPSGAIYLMSQLGDPTELVVFAEGEPLPSYQWRKDGTNIAGGVANSYTIPVTSTNDAGRYDVVVFSTYGSVTSQIAEVTVVLSMPTNVYLYAGDTAVFQARVIPDTARYSWQSNSTVISSGTTNTYRIANFNNTNAVPYSVIISNQSGSVTGGPFYAYLVDLDFDTAGGAKGVDKPATTTNVILSWPSITNRYYDILWTTNLMAGTNGFSVIASNLPGTPAVNVYTDTVHGSRSHGFYRIRAKESP